MTQKNLDGKTLRYLIGLLKKFTEVVDGGVVRYNDFGEYDNIIDTIVDGLYYGDESFIDLFEKKKLSRNYLIISVSKQIPKILSANEGEEKLQRYLVNPLLRIVNAKKKESTIYLAFPINVDFHRVKKFRNKICYKGTEIELLNYYKFTKTKFFTNDVYKEIKKRSIPNDIMRTHLYFLIIKHKGPDIRFSIDFCCNLLTEILALFNLAKNFNIITQHFGNKLYAISLIKFPPVIFYYDAWKRYKNYLYSDNLPYEKHIVFDDRQYERFIYFFDLIQNLPKNTKLSTLIFDNLRLYHSGIADIDISSSSLKFWNSIESVTKINDKGHVPERANSILTKPSPKWRIKLEIIREKRNLFAHKSISNFVQSDRYFLKRVSEEIFIFLINHAKMLKTLEDLDILYKVASKNKEQLKHKLSTSKRELELIKYVFKERKERAPKWLSKIK